MRRGRVAVLDGRGRGHVRDRGGSYLGLGTARDGVTVHVARRGDETEDGRTAVPGEIRVHAVAPPLQEQGPDRIWSYQFVSN